ncbi:hypothetical protein AN958_09822 [Leucoagaricus sp. SymC.cos]|nr:hypothetical protein AN958_09822 [Leucoagaricus sp. SymC.cos]
MTAPFKPTTPHSINPFDPVHPLLYTEDERTSHIRALTIHTEAHSGEPRPQFIQFLNRLHALEKLVIHWKALDWVLLGGDELQALVRLFSLPSLKELEVLASANFPLCLFRYFTAKKIHLEASAVATAVMPLFAADTQTMGQGALVDLSLVGAQNIREFRTFMEWQTDRAQEIIRSIKCLQCSISWRDQGQGPQDPLKDVSSLLLKISTVAPHLEEFRLVDWQSDLIKDRQIDAAYSVNLTSLKRLSMRYGASIKATEKTMESMNECARPWLLPFLSNLPSPRLLETLDVMFSFVVPFPWPTDLHKWMRELAKDLADKLVENFPRVQKVSLTFDLRNAHTVQYDWVAFNNALHPIGLAQRGVDCKFKAVIYRP